MDPRTERELYQILAPEERQAADRALREEVRRRRIAAQGRLRILLGRYLKVEPAGLRFRKGPRGKPYLEGEPAPLQFNLAHSGGLALAAVHPELEVGVDVERRRRGIATEAIAGKFFSPGEAAWLRELEEAEREEAFYRIWTAKEAFVKAHGAGLSFGLGEFTVSVAGAYRMVEIRGGTEEARRWTLWRLEPGPGYVGAAAVRARGLELRCYDWPEGWDPPRSHRVQASGGGGCAAKMEKRERDLCNTTSRTRGKTRGFPPTRKCR